MPSQMERILGAKIGRDQEKLWGTGEGEDPQKVRLVTLPADGSRGGNFSMVTEAISPPQVTHGGCVLQDDLLTPDGERFAVLTFHGDVEGWQRQIEDGAALLSLTTAKILGDRLVLSDGRSFPIETCTLEPA